MIDHLRAILLVMFLMVLIAGLLGCTDNLNESQHGASKALPPAPEIVDKARALIESDYPEAANYRTVMGGSPNAYARYHYDREEIELTSLWVELANSSLKKGACVIVHEWGHSLYYNQDEATALEYQCLNKI